MVGILEICGNCAAFPCFRNTKVNERGYLCHQDVRQCRQECDKYHHDDVPAAGGVCRIDNQPVEYCQECHILDIRNARTQAK